MKYNKKIYAQLLVELMEEQKEGIAEKFFKLLQKNGDLKKAKDIIQLTEKIVLKKTGAKKVVLEFARTHDLSLFRQALQGNIIEQKVNPELIAGVKITVNNENQLDYSLKNKLDEVFK